MLVTKFERQLGITALVSLALGVLLYAVFRPAASVVLLPNFLARWQIQLPSFFFNNFASLIHAFAFTLLTIVVLGLGKKAIVFSALFWMLLTSLFEAFQHPYLTDTVLSWGLSPNHILGSYFYFGSFDAFDIIFSFIGIFLAGYLSFRRKHETN